MVLSNGKMLLGPVSSIMHRKAGASPFGLQLPERKVRVVRFGGMHDNGLLMLTDDGNMAHENDSISAVIEL
jgi:hypothetical protein